MADGDLMSVFRALGDSQARYLVVGGVAVVLHGHLRVTADVDLVVELSAENAKKALSALSGLGYRPRAPVALMDFADERLRTSWVNDKGLTVFSLWSDQLPGTEIDLFVREPFAFNEAWARATTATIDGVHIHVASIDDLIELKRHAGRPKDLDDIAALEALKP